MFQMEYYSTFESCHATDKAHYYVFMDNTFAADLRVEQR